MPYATLDYSEKCYSGLDHQRTPGAESYAAMLFVDCRWGVKQRRCCLEISYIPRNGATRVHQSPVQAGSIQARLSCKHLGKDLDPENTTEN